MLAYLGVGAALGLTAGLSPGPLLTFVVTQSLRHGMKEGAKAALSPLFTDTPMILLTLFVLTRLKAHETLLGVISLAGAGFVVLLALEGLRTKGLAVEESDAAPRSLGKGVLVNILNPHPYLFWMTVGSPTILKAAAESRLTAAMFLGSFFCCLVGAKLGVAALTGSAKRFIQGRPYIFVMRGLGAVLLCFAALLVRDGLRLFGVTF